MLNKKGIEEEIIAYKAHNDQLDIGVLIDFKKSKIKENNIKSDNIYEDYYKYLYWVFKEIDYTLLDAQDRSCYGKLVLYFIQLQNEVLKKKINSEWNNANGEDFEEDINNVIAKFKEIIKKYATENLNDKFWKKAEEIKEKIDRLIDIFEYHTANINRPIPLPIPYNLDILTDLFAGNYPKPDKVWTDCGNIQKLLFMEIVLSVILILKKYVDISELRKINKRAEGRTEKLENLENDYRLEQLRTVFLMNIYITNLKYINRIPQFCEYCLENISVLHRYFVIKFYELLKNTYNDFEDKDLSKIEWIIEEERRNREPAKVVKLLDYNKLKALLHGYMGSDCPYLKECAKKGETLDDDFFKAHGSFCPYWKKKNNECDICCTAKNFHICWFDEKHKLWDKISIEEFRHFFKVSIDKSTLSRFMKGKTGSSERSFIVELDEKDGLTAPFLLYDIKDDELVGANKYDGTVSFFVKLHEKLLCDGDKLTKLKEELIKLRKEIGYKRFDEIIRVMANREEVVYDYTHIKRILKGKQGYCFKTTEKKMEEIIKQIEKSLEEEDSLK